MLSHLCAASRALLIGLLVGLLACHEVGPTIRVGTERAEIVVHALDAPDQHVEVAPAAFMEALGFSGGLIVPVARPPEHARRLMGYPGYHVHFGEGEKSPALNNDGTWKHNPTPIPKAVQEWLTGHGWKLPE